MQEMMKKHRDRLVREGIVKALLYAAVAAFAALAVCAAVLWFVNAGLIWIGAVVFAAVLLIAAPVIYFAALRPDEKRLARRMDRDLSLEERTITMLELRGSDDILARYQREDAASAIRGAGAKGIAMTVVSAAMVVGIAVSGFFGVGFTAVSALSAAGILPSGMELLGVATAATTFTVSYQTDGTGSLTGDFEAFIGPEALVGYEVVLNADGEALGIDVNGSVLSFNGGDSVTVEVGGVRVTVGRDGQPQRASANGYTVTLSGGQVVAVLQTVEQGESAGSVRAVPGLSATGEQFYFAGWWSADAATPYRASERLALDPYRQDEGVTAEIELVAVFSDVEILPFDAETDQATQLPSLPSNGGGGSQNDGKPNPDDNTDKEENNDGSGDGGGGSGNPSHQVIDGETAYDGPIYESSKQEAADEMGSDESMPEDLVGVVEDFYDIIER